MADLCVVVEVVVSLQTVVVVAGVVVEVENAVEHDELGHYRTVEVVHFEVGEGSEKAEENNKRSDSVDSDLNVHD